MCEQTEINYLDGDIVWVKLGSYWWPGQVVGLDKLPDDIQAEFKKKPIIAAVKFFQENSFEFVKTYHQIYKYNCTQKEEFIRKGLDKYRAKSKDGSNYMDKFPEDVKTAEILTNGDPYILLNKKFNPKEKPDISGLFGEKKIIKKKRSRDDYVKKVDDEIRPRITHPRFLQENDHEVRIRKQPKMLPLSSNNYSSVGIYPCHVCGFTATRVNIIICHLKNHRINKEVKVTMNSKIKTGIPLKQKQTNLDSPKRKYIRKLVSSKVKNNSAIETGKRKYCKQIEKPIKKKKSDPELREKLLADWNVDTDEDEPLYFEKSLNDCTVDLSNKKLSCLENSDMVKLESGKYNNDSLLILQASNKLLIETDSTTDFSIIEKDKSNSKMNVKQNMDENQEKCTNIVIENSFLLDDKKSKLSCFDFDEDDVLEESISTVRKIPRSLGSKNMSIKKEIIKEFQMSQALKMDKDLIKNNENKLNIQINKDLIMVKDKVQITEDIEDNKILKNEENTNKCQNWDKNREEVLRSEELCETHLEIVEIFEVEKENVDLDKREEQKESINLKNDHISEFNIQEYIKLRTNETIDNINTEKDILLETQDKKNEFKSINTNKSKEIKRNECKELVQLEQDSSNLLSVKSNISNKTSIIETKNDFPSSGNMNQFCETKLKTNSPVDYVNDEQNNSDTEVSPILECALQGLLIDKQKNNPINDNLNIVDKKQRGRPKKKKSIIEDILSDNDDQKVNTLKKKFEHLKKLSDLDLNQSNSIQKQNSDSYSNLHTLKSNYREIKVNENFLGNDIDIKQKMVNKKLEGNEVNSKIINKIQNSNSSLKNTYTTNIEGSIKEDIFEIEKSIEEKSDTSIAVATLHDDKGDLVVQSEHSNENSEYDDFADNYNLKDKKKKKKIFQMKQNNSKPYEKKGQINKFEFQMNYLDNNKIECSVPESNDNLYKGLQEKKDMTETQNGTPLKLGETSQVENILNREISEKILETCSEIPKKVKNKLELTKLSTTPELNNYLKLLEIHNTEKYAPELVLKLKKEKLDESQFDSFQDAFVKTLQVDCSLKKEIVSEISKLVTTKIEISDTKKVSITESVKTPSISANNMIMNFSIMNNFDNTEGVADNTKTEEKSTENNLITNYISNELLNNSVSNMKNNSIIEMDSIVTIEDKKIINNSTNSISITTAPTLSIPVKKREKPRIIENVALKEPMILKTKLIDKHVANIGKHKLDHDKIIADESKNISKTKLIKMETVICNTKTKLHNRSNNIDHITKKIKSLKSDNSSLKVSKDTENQELISTLPQIVSEISCADKYIQQSSQNLVDVDLDIISMPFVLSEDVLTPESIQQMPVVISSVLPAKIPITTLSSTLITSSKEISGTNYLIKSVKDVNEIGAKKKSGVPTILKNKNKLKPTITSIKTIVPPLTCKKNFKLNAQTLKTSLANKKTPGKYVIVQTSGHQQAYSTHPKVSIPTNKGSGNAQIVQHGSKVVILTSPQCGQSGQKILPFNSISKALSNGKVQRIITSKQGQEMYTSVSSENFVNSKNILASNNVLNSSITSRINNQKILSQQITSKSVLTQLPGTITKSVFGTLPQGIFIKEGVFTPINPSTLSGKTIISSKTFVTKGFAHQGINTLKNTLPQPLVSKTIINSQGIVSKGTVLTPITGSQVKALAAKNIKGNKLQYQLDPYKVQSGDTQNSLSVSSSSFIKNSTNFKTSNNVMILQKTDLKTVKPKKKFIKQTVPKKTSETAILSPSSTITLQKSKGSTNFEENNVSSKILNRSVNQQHKVFTDKTEKIMKINSVNNETLPIKPRIFEQRKNKTQISKSNKSINRSLHKKNSNLTKSVALSSLNSGTSISMTIPSSQIINYENIPKKEEIYESTSSKKETEKSSFQMQETLESTISVQSQIMALPTENSDGTQAYVLVTIDEHGHIGPLDNSTLMSLDGTSNLDGNKTLYIDSSSLSESGNISNIVLQIDNNSLSNTYNTNILNSVPTSVIETLPLSQNMQTTNQDILAVALANTDFQHEIGVAESSSSTSITSLTQTSLINQTILQSTIIPPTEPISSPSVLETSLTLNQPIMTPLEIPSSVSIQPNITPVTTVTTVPTSIELPISLTNQSISYTTAVESLIPIPEKSKETITLKDIVDVTISANTQLIKSDKDISTPSMEMIDDNFNTNNGFDSTNTSLITENNLDNYITKTSEELIQDLTGNDSLQENNESLQNISNDKITSSQQVILEAPKIIYSHIQDDSVLSEQNIKTTLKQFQKKNKLDLLNDLHKIEEKINTHEHVNTNINVLSESIVKVSENTVIIEQSNIFQEDNQMMNDKLHKKEKYQKKLSKITNDKPKITELSTKNVSGHSINSSVQNELNEVILKEYKIKFNDDENEINEKISSQSYKEFINIANDPSQFERSDSSHQSMQSFSSESLETNESILVQGLPVQSYEDLKQNENFQTQKSLNSNIINKSTQSLKKNLTLNDKTISINEDNSNFSSQNCNIAKIENYIGIMEAEADIGHEGSSPSISNDTCIDGVGPSSVSVNNLVLNEDETASSSYVPETPENQERDQDQESAISTSSYEIPPCEELNIASSSMIPDPSMQSEHLSIHNNDLPRITTSYNLNSDSNSTDVIAVSTSNYDQIIIEQNISTSYDVPISIGNTDKMNSQNYISDNLERRNESTSYYPHEEVSENYYDTICKQSSSQLETTSELESTPSYFESNPVDVISETSQNYFNQEEIVSNYSNHEIPSTYYDSRIENEKSFYSSHEENSTRLQHTEATQNFYQNRQHDQPVITTYTDRYSLDYVTESSSLDRHDLVDSSKIVKPMSR